MVALECPYCGHANPDGAKFCNACGSHLQLKLCSHCQAANDQAVKTCYECGTEFPVSADSPEAAARAACERLQQLLRSAPPPSALSTVPVAATLGEVGVNARPRPITEPANETRAQIRRRESRKSAWTTALLSAAFVSLISVCAYFVNQHPEKIAELLGVTNWISTAPADVSRAGPSVLPIPGTSGVPTPSEASNTVRKPAAAAIPSSAPATQIGAMTGAPSVAPSTDGKDSTAASLAAKRQDASTAAGDAVTPASSPARRTSLPEAGSVRTPAIQTRANAAAASPQAGICSDALAAAGLCSIGASDNRVQTPSQTRSAAISQPPVSPIDQAMPARPSAIQDKAAGETPQVRSNIAAKPRNETVRSATSRVVPGNAVANRSAATTLAPVQSQPEPGRANVAPASPRASVCTEALAAAGLCSPSSTEGSK
jgi:Double zinc ribbon